MAINVVTKDCTQLSVLDLAIQILFQQCSPLESLL